MLERIDELLEAKVDFAIETTLATRSYVSLVTEAQSKGYSVVLLFLWLRNPELAQRRVSMRVEQGGHSIPPETIVRRYGLGLKNLFNLYLPIVDEWLLFDNSTTLLTRIADGVKGEEPAVTDSEAFDKMKSHV